MRFDYLLLSGHVNLDVVDDAAEDGVVGPGRLMDRARDELRDGPMRHEARDEALPGGATAEIAVESEAPVLCAEDLTGPYRVRLRRHPRPVPSEGVECVLHDRHRVQLDEARTCLLVRLEIAGELLAPGGTPRRRCAAPADAAVAAICAAEVLDPCAVVADRLGGCTENPRLEQGSGMSPEETERPSTTYRLL